MSGGGTDSPPRRGRAALIASVPLFCFWIALSEKFDLFHLGLGAASAIAVAWAVVPLHHAAPTPLPNAHFVRIPLCLHHLAAYAAWLLKEIFVAAFRVATVVLDPRLPIRPGTVRITDRLPHPLARATLAHSITLTPGTVTLECDETTMVVHALNKDAAASLAGDGGAMAARVRRLYARLAPSGTSEGAP